MFDLLMLISAAAIADGHGSSEGHSPDGFTANDLPIETMTLSREYILDFVHPREQTCQYLDPRHRNLYIEEWQPEVAYQPDPDRLSGMILRIPSSNPALANEPGTAVLTHVGYHDADWNLAYTVNHQQIRLEVVGAACMPYGDNGSRIMMRITMVGLHRNGVEEIEAYVEAGGIDADMIRFQAAINAAIEE